MWCAIGMDGSQMNDLVKHLRENVMDAATRMLHSHFNTEGPRPDIRIPARPDQDTDCVLVGGIKDAADEIERLREQTQWRGIESAPKDGTEILGARPDDSHPHVIKYAQNEHTEICWWHARDGWGYSPTNWLPLPSPPVQEESE